MAPTRGPAQPKGGRSWWRWLAAASLVVVLLVIAGAAWLWWLSRQPPPFYARALRADAARPVAEGDEFERRVLATRNTARRPGSWLLELTEDQINGWFAARLPEAFPDALPESFADPRVAISDGRLELGGRYRSNQIDAVVSLELAVTLGDDPNVLAARVVAVRWGQAPVPAAPLVKLATDAARRANLPLRWTQAGREPIALLTVPERAEAWGNRRVRLETVSLLPGKLILSGRTE